MRIIDLDFYADKGGAIFLGYAGEHLSTVLNFHMPAELGNNDCVYVVNFLKDGESSSNVVSHFAYKSRFDTNIVEYYIPSSIMGSGASSGVFHLVAYGMTTTINNEVKYSILGKSTEFHYVIDDAITTDTSDLNITLTDSESITMQNLIAAINQLGNIQAALGSLDTLVGTLENFIGATDVYEQKENNSDISINDILTSTLSEADKNKYLNLYRIKELARNLKASINNNTNNISSLSTKVGSGSFDDSTKIGDVTPVNIMDALVKISTALTSLNNDKISKNKAIKYTSTNILNNCIEPGTIYRYIETINDNLNGLAVGDYTVIPSYIGGTGNLAQYIFSTTGAIYYRCRTLENGSYTYTIEKLVTRQEFSALNDIVNAIYRNKTTSINETTLTENNRNKLYPTTGAVDDYIKVLSGQGIIGQKDYIVSYSLPAQSSWTQITGGYKLELNTNLISGYNFTNKTKIDIEPTIELYTILENSFCTGLYAETKEDEEVITYNFIALNKAPNAPIDVQLKLSEVNYSEE